MRRSLPCGRLLIVEHRFRGHRLAYLALAARAHGAVDLVTTSDMATSEEYAVHLSPLADAGIVTVTIDDRLPRIRAVVEWIACGRRTGRALLVPECDAMLPLLVALKVANRLPWPTSMIVARAPDRRDRNLRRRVWGVAKTAMIASLMCFERSVDVLLVEDGLADPPHRVWRRPVNRADQLLEEPGDLIPRVGGRLPLPQFGNLDPRVPVLAVVGAIDDRKNLPMILDAWARRADRSAALLVAGKPQGDSESLLGSPRVTGDPSITVITRYLSNDEISACLERATALFMLYDLGLTSSLMMAAALNGRWVIGIEGTRTARVASSHGFAITFDGSVEGLAHAIDHAIACTHHPQPVPVMTGAEWGRRVTRLARAAPGAQAPVTSA
jgi:hypothetical protein